MRRKRNCRNRRNNHHHIIASSLGGQSSDNNLLLMDEKRHECYHILFGRLTLLEAAKLLIRTARAKEKL